MNDSHLITKTKVLVVEGKDEKVFFDAILRKKLNINDVQTIDVGGKDQFKTRFPVLVKRPGFIDVEKLAIVRDAEDNINGTHGSILDVLRRCGFTPPEKLTEYSDSNPQIGIWIMPDNVNNGMLEDLCLQTVLDHPAMECVNKFMECAFRLTCPPKNPAKSKSLAFLAAMPELVSSVGLGAEKQYWNFDSPRLSQLIKFLEIFK
jgi:hypothetical protein